MIFPRLTVISDSPQPHLHRYFTWSEHRVTLMVRRTVVVPPHSGQKVLGVLIIFFILLPGWSANIALRPVK